MTWLAIALWIVIAFQVFGLLVSISTVGKDRKPLTPGVAATSALVSLIILTVLVLAALVVAR